MRKSLLGCLYEITENPAKAHEAVHDPEMVKLYNRFVEMLRAMAAERDRTDHALKPIAFRIDHTASSLN